MNEQQKRAIDILNKIRYGGQSTLSDDEYFALMEFVMAQPKEVYVPQYVPQYPQYPSWPTPPSQPMQPYYKYDTITCNKG